MDFLDPKKKRAHRIRLLVGYSLMAVAIAIGTFILLLEAFGYDVYTRSGTIVQNGLVFVDNRPQPADIFVNGAPEGQTDKRLVLPEGEYEVRLEREGYRQWLRRFMLMGTTVVRLTYPLLIPVDLEPKDSQLYSERPLLATQSPDRRWLLVSQPDSLTDFNVVDLNDQNNPATQVSLPEGLLNVTPGDHAFEAVEWSTNNRHVLLKHTFPGGIEYLVIDWREPGASYNVNGTFSVPVSRVALRDKRPDQLYISDTSRTVWIGESANGRLTPVAEQVFEFRPHGSDVLLYVADDETAADGNVTVYLRQNDTDYRLRELPKDNRYVLDIARYDGRWYVAAGAANDRRAFVYEEPFDMLSADDARFPAPIAVLRLNGPVRHLSFSANAQFIGAQSGSKFSVYDAEHDRQYRFEIEPNLPVGYKATWMDSHRYVAVSDGTAIMFDFDGSNLERLTQSYQGYLPFFDRDYEQLYTIGPSITVDGRPALIQTQLRIPSDI